MSSSETQPLGLLSLLLALAGCGRLLGADEYGFANGAPPAGSTIPVENKCPDGTVLTDSGRCEPVGARDCAAGFYPSDLGCTADLPPFDCPWGIAVFDTIICNSFASACESDAYAPPGTQFARVAYVDSSSAVEGDGQSKSSAFRTINAALARERSPEPLELLIRGEFHEDVAIDRSDVTIRACAGNATIVGQHPTQRYGHPCFSPSFPGIEEERRAALCVAPGVSSVTLHGLQITGPGDGVGVRSGTGVRLEKTRIYETKYFGLRIMEVNYPVISPAIIAPDVELDEVAIYQAHGAGILVAGATLTVKNSSIQQTLSLNDWANPDDPLRAQSSESARVPKHMQIGWARGISIHPGFSTSDPARVSPEDFTRSNVTIERSVITGHEELAVFAAGAVVDLNEVFLGATPSSEPAGRGIVAERALPTASPTQVTVRRSVIERASDAAVDIRDASVDLSQTTIRDTRSRPGDGCSGQGVRVRSLPTGDNSRSVLDVSDSSILGSRQAGVFAASSTVSLTRTLIRDVEPDRTVGACARAMGDGVALEGYSGQDPSDATLDRVRIQNASRAALTWSGGPLTMNSILLACNERNLVDPTGLATEPTDDAVCGCGTTWTRCVMASEPLDAWIVSGSSGAWPDVTASLETCNAHFLSGKLLDGMSYSSFFSPEIAASQTGEDGCTWTVSSRHEIFAPLTWKPGYSAYAFHGHPDEGFVFVSQERVADGFQPLTVGIPKVFPWRAPPGSRITATPGAPIVGVLGTPNGNEVPPPFGSLGAGLAALVDEPGWYTLELSDAECGSSDYLGAHTRPNVRFARVEWGVSTAVDFGHCRALGP